MKEKNEGFVCEKFYLTSRVDGLRLHVLVLQPDDESLKEGNVLRGVVQICHGMCEHKERYLPFMKKLCQNGYAAVIHDHRGHGKSVRDEKDLGYFYDKTGEAVIEDVYQITCWIRRHFPNLPVHLFGHSMGSLIVRCYLKKHNSAIDSLVVCGSPSANSAVLPGIFMAKAACLFAPKKEGRFFQKLISSGYRKCLEPGGSENGWISYNRENVREYDKNPFDGFVFTNNGFLNLFLLMKNTYAKAGWQVKNPALPVLFVAGADDPCIGSKKKYARAVHNLQSHGYQNVKAVLFSHMRHEILKEKDSGRAEKVLLRFLQEIS